MNNHPQELLNLAKALGGELVNSSTVGYYIRFCGFLPNPDSLDERLSLYRVNRICYDPDCRDSSEVWIDFYIPGEE